MLIHIKKEQLAGIAKSLTPASLLLAVFSVAIIQMPETKTKTADGEITKAAYDREVVDRVLLVTLGGELLFCVEAIEPKELLSMFPDALPVGGLG